MKFSEKVILFKNIYVIPSLKIKHEKKKKPKKQRDEALYQYIM